MAALRPADPMPMADNLLYYGDNLDVLRRYVTDESVDLVYLDPPFNSGSSPNRVGNFGPIFRFPAACT
jgi:hypothetical protein